MPKRMQSTTRNRVGPTYKVKAPKPFMASPELCEALKSIGTILSVSSGEILFRKGDATKGVFLVLSGRVALSAGDDPVRITRIAEKGSILGLPATVRNKPYSLTAETVTECQLCRVTPEPFRELLSQNPAFGMSVIAMLAEEVSVLRKLAVYKA